MYSLGHNNSPCTAVISLARDRQAGKNPQFVQNIEKQLHRETKIWNKKIKFSKTLN